MATPTRNQKRQREEIRKVPISHVALTTKTLPSYLMASSDLISKLSSTATKSLPSRSVNYMMTLNAATALVATKVDIYAKIAKTLKQNGRINLIKKRRNIGLAF
jgi:hypothetical protein